MRPSMLGIKPGQWTPAVVITRFNGLVAMVNQELNLAQAVRALGPNKVKDLEYFQPANPRLDLDPSIDATLLSREVLELYSAFREPIRFTPDELVAEYRAGANSLARLNQSTAIDLSDRPEEVGSNNWVVSGKLTSSGFPMMMNDPHRVQGAPSLRYWVHLVAPGWNVIGGGEPALPGVSVGHNEYGAWGLTIFGGDTEDLSVYQTNPVNPSQNMVWADREGNIGYQAVGISPRRPNWSGLVPVPGDGRYEWNGYLPIKLLPNAFNPEKGFWNTSNNYLIPPGWVYKDALHYTWAEPYRAMRVAEVLGSGRLFTVGEMVRLQNDDLSIPARILAPLLRDLKIGDGPSQKARERLLAWNNVLDKDSVPAGIYEMWQRRLQANLRDLLVPKEAQPFITNLNMKRLVDWLLAPDGRFGADPIAGRDALISKSLTEAVVELTKRFGSDIEKWKLGEYHYALIRHPLSPALKLELQSKFDVGDLPRGGDSYTVTATGSNDNQTSGGSFKIIVDTEDWDNSVGLNNPGQSGDANDPHYRDLYELWARGKYFPIFYSRRKVESVAERVIKLAPSTVIPSR